MSILLVIHIIIAVCTVAVSLFAALRPTSTTISRSSELLAATIISGTSLLFAGASLLHVCVSGLLVTSATTILIYVASRRLPYAKS